MKGKVLFVLARLDAGGLETYLLRFLRYTSPAIHVVIFCKTGEKGPLSEVFERDGIQVIANKMGYLNPVSFFRFTRFLVKEKFTAICDFTGNFAGVYLLLATVAGVSKRIVFYRQGQDHFKPSLLKVLYNDGVKLLTRVFATNILFNSVSAHKYFYPRKDSTHSRFQIIRNGVNEELFVRTASLGKQVRDQLGIPQGAFVIGHTGRFDRPKNHSTILKVAKELLSEDENVYFLIAGKDTELLMSELNTDGIRARIKLLGYREDIPELLNAMDVFFFPSITEGQPNSLLEAMMSDLMIVASNIPPIVEIVPEEFVEKLIDPFDVSRYCEVLKELHENENIRDRFRLKDFAVGHFNSQVQFQQFLNVLLESNQRQTNTV